MFKYLQLVKMVSIFSNNVPCSTKSHDNFMRDLWNSMYNVEVITTISEEGVTEVCAIMMLLATAINNLKTFGSEYSNLQVNYRKTVSDLEKVQQKYTLLKDELKNVKLTTCDKCPNLNKKIREQEKEIEETKRRIQSIANILDVNYKTGFSNEGETQNALTLMTEMLMESKEADKFSSNQSKVKKNLFDSKSKQNTKVKESSKVLASDSLIINEINTKRSPVKYIIIPETEDPNEDVHTNYEITVKEEKGDKIIQIKSKSEYSPKDLCKTPKKMKDSEEKMIENSPILDRSSQRKRLRSSQSINDLSRSLHNLAQDELNEQSFDDLLPCSVANLNKSPEKDLSTKSSPTNRKRSSKKKTKNVEKELISKDEGPVVNAWALKPSRNTDDIFPALPTSSSTGCGANNVKRLKQMTLSVKPVQTSCSKKSKDYDITTMIGFNGGVHASSSLDKVEGNEPCSDDDVITSSPSADKKKTGCLSQKINVANFDAPKQTKKKNRQDIKFSDTMDETLFQPLASSTEKMDCSFDRVPGRLNVSPKYKYQRDAVRKKADRMNLPGRQCDDCVKYYQACKPNMKGSEIRTILNKCSRHRNKYSIRSNTPPGFWDPEFPTSSEEDSDSDFKQNKKRSKQ